MTATQVQSSKTTQAALYVSFELGWWQWKLAFGTSPGEKARLRAIGARCLGVLQEEFAKAKKRFGLPEDAPIYSCYEAGRDGFWLHRWLELDCLSYNRQCGQEVNGKIDKVEKQNPRNRMFLGFVEKINT